MSVALSGFLQQVRQIAAEGPKYRLGGYARDGTCDCIGLTIGAIRRAGGEWKGTHGSNYAARYEMDDLRRVTTADLRPGWQVLKAKEPGASGWKLPGRYAGHADQRDYYHAGVVTGVDPLEITHSTGTGKPSSIKVDTRLGAWGWGGPLKKVRYGVAAEAQDAAVTAPDATAADAVAGMSGATVHTQNGGPLKLRAKPIKSCRLYWTIPCGAAVEVLQTDTGSDGWWKVRYGRRTGYCWNQYLAVG